MRMVTDTMYRDNYRFVVESDSGSETGTKQLTVWVAEETDIDAVPLKQFGAAQLLSALIEPEKSRLHAAIAKARFHARCPDAEEARFRAFGGKVRSKGQIGR